MESPSSLRLALSPSKSVRRRSSASNSPEFEFWMARNPSIPPPRLLSADELFSGGVLLPLHLLNHHNNSNSEADISLDSVVTTGEETNSVIPNSESGLLEPDPGPTPTLESSARITTESAASATASVLTTSKRWTDIFRKKLNESGEEREGKKEKKRERKNGGSGSNSAELNINIWPFARSKSAGNNSSRPRTAVTAAVTAANRKVSSAPCSRSNSSGESKSRKWASSPGRSGVHLGRSSPVWQARRVGSSSRNFDALARNAEKHINKEVLETRRIKLAKGSSLPRAAEGTGGGGGGGGRVLNMNVPMCKGYRNHLNFNSDDNGGDAADAGDQRGSAGRKHGGGGGGDGGRGGDSRPIGGGGNIFNLRSLFTKKVQVL
ncbi:hypothetical protein Nepgr_028715 [Nepenthes gracilis]|uniref:Uncharacterized protein n=1 Tax=Nepenthes gracilis TaxID=150966 RepID=A0AAD3TCK3_NEPGR|nr:hypothetical protein Nepgr_028715 [Nepenthes gracilis]